MRRVTARHSMASASPVSIQRQKADWHEDDDVEDVRQQKQIHFDAPAPFNLDPLQFQRLVKRSFRDSFAFRGVREKQGMGKS